MIHSYTDKELKELLSSLTILVDTREQENGHVTAYFDKKKIPYVKKALNFADYSCMIPANPELGITRDMYFTDAVVIERKNSLTELSNNLSNDRDRFISELIRKGNAKLCLMIENTIGYSDILNHKYNTHYSEKSYLATLFSFQARFNINITFLPDKSLAGLFVFSMLHYHVRNYLLGR